MDSTFQVKKDFRIRPDNRSKNYDGRSETWCLIICSRTEQTKWV